MKTKGKIFADLYVALILIVVMIPLVSMVIFSFNESRSLIVFSGFTFNWYVDLFTARDLREPIMNTLLVAGITTFVAVILGTLGAIALSKQNRLFREIALSANNIPILSPDILTAVAFFVFLLAFSIERGLFTMILAHISFSTPYALLAIYPKVRSLDTNLVDAAYDLGATPGKALWKVVFPQLRGSIIAGAAIAFTMSFDDYIISKFASGELVNNISTYMYSQSHGIRPNINALSTIIIFIIGIKVVLDYVKLKNRKQEE
ncbi:ABC transporter permease [Acholeplasma granularum]|uniref:ABC transporter permease n=1 Tax=Acholeplasma granularum TaxID=264635 RepID=UPI0004B51DA6|nr:ABC transporter permease [Acholeplasma granularum]